MFFTRTSCAVRTGKSGILFFIPLFFLRRVCYNDASIMKKVHSAGFLPVTFVYFCHHTPQGDTGSRPALLHSFVRRSGAAAFFVKFWAVPDFFRNFSNCGSFRSFYIRIRTVSHWKFPQKSGRNFSVSGVFLCRIPCYNGNKSFQTCFSHIPLLFCPKEMIP